jgi:cytochrome b
MHRLRIYHAALAVLTISAYLTGEIVGVHIFLGYAVAAVILLRLTWAVMGERQLGLQRFYSVLTGPHLQAGWTHPAISLTLISLISLSLIGVVGTGVALEQGRAVLGLFEPATTPTEMTPSGPKSGVESAVATRAEDEDREADGESEGGALKGIHELFANALLILVPLHVLYLLMFKRALVKFMLFFPKKDPAP